jgi:hypothetical protein
MANLKQQNYTVKSVKDAKKIGRDYLNKVFSGSPIEFGLPEIDDRYHSWRVPLLYNSHLIGEVVAITPSRSISLSRRKNC